MEEKNDFEKSKSLLFKENIVYKPFAYPWAEEMRKKHEIIHWVPNEVPMGNDVTQWNNGTLNENERSFITNILRLFTEMDAVVGRNYKKCFIPTIKNNEVSSLLASFCNREALHTEAYSLVNETIGLPDSEYASFLQIKELSDKVDFAMESDTSTIRGFGLTVAKSVFNEGVSLFSSFVMLLNFQRYGKMLGMNKIVEWSIRDETMHVEGMAKLFRTICEENKKIVTDKFKKEIYEMARKIVELEDTFIDLVYQDYVIEGLSKEDVKEYIRYVADRRLIQLGLKGNFKVKENPLKWLEWILNASNHTNFFENKVSEYDKAPLVGEYNWEKQKISKFKIISRDGCPYCVKAVETFVNEGFDFEEIKLNDQEKRNEFYDSLGLEGNKRTVPQIWEIDENGSEIYIGGYSQLKEKLS